MHIYSRAKDTTFNGFYIPSVFYMEIKTTDSLDDLNKLSDTNKATFFHEYVHFLQDITTTFGLTNIVDTVELQKAMNIVIRESENPDTFAVPVEISEYESTRDYNRLNSLFYGDPYSDFNDKSIIKQIKPYPNKFIPGHEEKEMIVVQYTNAGEASSFQLGAIQIMESMAYLVERNLYKTEKSAYPYKVVERVVQHLYPELNGNDALLVTLCDYGLMAPDPGRFLFQFVNHIKERDVRGEQGIYNVLRDYKFHSADGAKHSVFQLFELRHEQALKSLKDYFTVKEFESIREWMDAVLQSAATVKMQKMHFWRDLMEQPTPLARQNYLVNLCNDIGFPLISNEIGQTVIFHAELYPKYLLNLKAIEEVANVLLGSRKPCGMIPICRKGENGDHTNEDCAMPWKRGQQDPLCPFGQIIKMWGLREKVPAYYL